MSETFARGRQVGPGELAQIRAAVKPVAGTSIDAASPVAMRAMIRAGVCPFCGESKYVNLGAHTARTHGHSAAEVREMAGMLKSEPLCSPELSEAHRTRLRGRALPAVAYERPQKRRSYSAAGRAQQRQKALAQPNLGKAGAAESGRRQMAANAAKYARAVEMWHAGSNLRQIGAVVGLHPRYVKQALERAGIAVGDGRAARWRRS